NLAASKTIDGPNAIQKALQHVNAQVYMWQDAGMEAAYKEQMKNDKATYYPAAQKVWYSGDDVNPSALRLAYKIDVYASQPESRAYYFIDAQTGAVLGSKERLHTTDAVGTANTLYSGTQTIHSDQTGASSFRLRDYSRGNGIITYNKGNGEITSTSANWNLTLPNQNGLDAHWGVEMTYDFYKANFNRNSVDNNGYALISHVNKGGFLYTNNASWDGSSMNYGTLSGTGKKGVTGIDVTGHELTHGVTQFTCNLNYSGESGGMNESISDIMGKSVQFWAKPTDINWLLSNDMSWFIRDLSNPNAFQQPDTYGGTYWKANADVHVLSGVGNFMFYLLVQGGSGVNDKGSSYNVSALGLAKADQIIYRSQTVYLVPTSKYANWRDACINSATDLYGAASNEVAQVKNAFYAVGIGTPALAPIAVNNVQDITVYPNPILGGANATVKFNLQHNSNAVVKIVDPAGNVMQVINLGQKNAGAQTVMLPKLNSLKTGDYYATIEENGTLTGRVKITVVQ
ncbi:MAG TPA: M4 family metallopeptidase, partial [Chitinophagaceae bacterium]|nr:M4 family metallopeptidase [Chitinophagaceae bacterium]